MHRTQDLALARLRQVAGRWSAHEPPDLRTRGIDATGDGLPDGPNPGDAPESGGSADRAWPTGQLWIRILGVIVGLAVIGTAGVLAISWPRQTGSIVGVSLPSPVAEPLPGNVGAAPMAPDRSPPATVPPDASLLVHIDGKVAHPGVFRLPAGSRVQDAVEAAGGLRRGGDVGGTNLARPLVDGERIDVGAVADVPGAGGTQPAGAQPVDLNLASAEQLDSLPGIGPVTAAKILAWRAANGRFTVVDELVEVPGIGPATLAELRPHVRV